MKPQLIFAAALVFGGATTLVAQDQTESPQAGEQHTEQIQQDREDADRLIQANDSDRQRDRADRVETDGQQVDEATANNIRGTLATITEAALTREQFRSVVQRLTDADQERIGDYADQEFEELDGRIAQFQEDWRARYGQDFDIDNRELVYSAEAIEMLQDHVGEAGLAAGRIDRVDGQREQQDQSQPDQQRDTDGIELRTDRQDDGLRVEAEADADRTGERAQADRDQADTGRTSPDGAATEQQERATVIMPESHGLPEVTVHLINEGTIMDAWRIDLPDDVDGPKLKENLQLHLTAANERIQQWPTDVNEAYRMVTHHVLLAIMDAHPDEYEDAQQAGHEQDAQMQMEPMGQRQEQPDASED